MVDSAWVRLCAVIGADASVKAAASALGVSYQAARKIKNGGGISLEKAIPLAKKRGISPVWLATGEGPMKAKDAPSPPPDPSGAARPFGEPTEEELRFLDDFRRLLDGDQEHYRREIAAKAGAMRKYVEGVLANLSPARQKQTTPKENED